ncbi:MAG: hypothetical protein EXX96DRAFT_484501 [Benjaminiella poitrasii]|nr:MAG: hypothetical protein EXX96DRAFT_484501 [Benjaminiella poitrasii]
MKGGFSLFGENILEDKVKLISWCPTTDLVLIVSPTNTISLFRHGDTLLWSIADEIESAIKVITWEPNGKTFALGCENGAVYKVDITHYLPKISFCWSPTSEFSPSPTVTLVWLNYEFKKKQIEIEDFDTDVFDFEPNLTSLSEEPPEEPISILPRPRRKTAPLPAQPYSGNDKQTLLFVGNAKGQIHIL